MMTASVDRPITPLRQRMLDDPWPCAAFDRIRSAITSGSWRGSRPYLGWPPDTATADDVRRFQLHQRDQGAQGKGRKDRNAMLSPQLLELLPLTAIGLRRAEYGTHSLRRTKAAMIYRATGNLRAIQIRLGHTKIENTVRYLGVDVEDALLLAERTEI